MDIKNHEDLRIEATKLNANIIGICNATNVDDVINLFLAAKDSLTSIFRYKTESLNEDNNSTR